MLLALFLFACESDQELNLPLDPNIANLNTYYKEIKLPFTLIQLDSVNTTVNNKEEKLLIGNYTSEGFGKVSATSFTDFSITNRETISESDNFDSLALIMVNNYYHGPAMPAQPQTLAIHQLTQNIAHDKSHYQFDRVPFDATPLGTLTFMPDSKATTSPDTLHIALSNTLGQDLFNKAKSKATEMSNDSLFQIYFKGVAFVPQSENDYMTGFAPTQMRMVMYYSEPNDTIPSTYTFALGATVTFNHITYNRTGTPIVGIDSSTRSGSAANGNFYLQSGTGLAPQLDFQPLENFADSIREAGQNLLFNSVELGIGFAKADSASSPPQELRGFYTAMEVPDRFTFSLDNQGQISSPGLFDDNVTQNLSASSIRLMDLSSYKLQMSRYMQALTNKTTGFQNKVLLLAPNFESSLDQLTTPADSVKLKIYYSILK